MSRTKAPTPYVCRGCDQRFPGIVKLREHHALCIPFAAYRDGRENTYADSQGRQVERP
jgi:hypothetical protein